MFNLQHLSVCLVEPSRPQGTIIQGYLKQLGIEKIDIVTDGQAGIARMHAVPRPDIVVSAMYLPDMTGADLVHVMRGDDDLREMPFVLISSETRPQQLDAIRQAGAMAILPKPFNLSQLDRALCSALDYLNAADLRASLEGYDLDARQVLLVDDSTTSRHYLRSVLERMGFEHISEAGNGVEAVPLLDAQQFDLILTDYNMPEMDGKALIEYIRSHPVNMSCPVLMISGEQDFARLAAVEEAGVSAICDKPFEIDTLRQLITQFL
ncbi:response regulator [Vogesella sp. LIG4]|uniref:response regulator n=1 Tax=Vogesella sp. LIG4 TaxID=1192162 RepID=UPI00081F755E|nr:response regulator [Vogesella sp. LIG4]SCK27794.1 two-component system, chemotaxis family, response regulator CheY [Vogesella sp. LIG4]